MLKGPPSLADGGEQRGNDVADVDEVARLTAVAVDRRRLALRHPLEEDRHDAALEPGVLPRPVHVGKTQCDMTRAVNAVPAGEIVLAALLRDAVGRERLERERLVDRAWALAVPGAARGREDHLCVARRLQHVRRADDVDGSVVVGALHRRLHVGLRGEVEDHVRVRLEGLADVVLAQLGLRVQVLTLAGGEVVDDHDVVAPRDQRVDEVGADEAGAACYQSLHARRIVGAGCS